MPDKKRPSIDSVPQSGDAPIIPLTDGDASTSAALARLAPEHRKLVLDVLRPFSPGAQRLSRMDRIDTLLSVPDPWRFVPSLPTEELYFFLQDVGVEDAADLVRYASSEQVQGFVDLGAWRRDSFDVGAFKRWFDIFVHNGPEEVQRLLRSIDPELIVLLLLRNAQVFDKREAPEDIPEGRTQFPSPDGSFFVEMDTDDELFPLVKAAIDAIYAGSVEEGRKFLQATRWEMPSQLEESCYGWRSSRLEDLGFLPFEEALESEQDIDIEQLERAVAGGVSAEEPGYTDGDVHPFTGWYLAEAHDAPYLARVLDELPLGAPRDRVLLGFTHIVNRRLSLRGLDSGEWDSLVDESGHAFRLVSIGLERLARATGRSGADLLEGLPLLAAYRVGNTLLARLRRRALAIAKRAGADASDAPSSPFDEPLDWCLEALRLTPPRRFAPPPVGTSGGAAPSRAAAPQAASRRTPRDFFAPFRSLAEVDEAEALLVQADAVLRFFEDRHGWGPGRFDDADLATLDDTQRTAARFSTLLLTGMANRVLDRSTDLRPLAADDVRDLLAMLFLDGPGGRKLDPRLKRVAQEQLLAVTGTLPDAEREALLAYVSDCLARFEDVLRGIPVDETPDPRFLGDVLLTQG